MPKTASKRKTRQSRKDAATRPAAPRATNSKNPHGRSLEPDAIPDMSNPFTVPYVNPKELRESPPVYSSVYSYNHEYLRIPKDTPVQPGVPSTSFGGTVRHMAWTEEMVNIMLKAEFGDVELGHQFMKRFYEGSEVIGGSPDPKDPSIRYIPIPGRRYHMRLWTGRMDEAELVCWQFLDNKTKQPKHRPDKVNIYDVSDSWCPQRLVSLEEGQHHDKTASKPYSCDTFAAPDGSIVDFVHKGKPFMRIQLPNRPKAGPPKIERHIEHKVMPVDPNQRYKAFDDDDGEEDEAQQDSDSDAD
ncbi:hypothetical protein FB107DRAFT_289930 [Schizophyllum commune]